MVLPVLTGKTLAEAEKIIAEHAPAKALLIEETNPKIKKGRSLMEAKIIRQQECDHTIRVTLSYF